MSSLVSPRVAALISKLRQAEHAGQYFSADDVAGFIRELRAIQTGASALEDRIAGQRRETAQLALARPSRPIAPPQGVPVGTFYFLPAGQH